MKVTPRDRDKEVLYVALQKLKEELPVGNYEAKWKIPTGKGIRYDAVLKFQRILHEYPVEIRRNINHKMIDAMEFYLAATGKTVILVIDEATETIARELRRREIQFIDTLGNMYLTQRDPFVHIYITGNRTQETVIEKPINVFSGRKLRVIFTLLTIKNAINLSYREIADLAGVALGTVGWTFNDLKQLGYIRVYKRNRKIMNQDKLMSRWLEAYPEKIRPKLNPRRFNVSGKNWWIRADFKRYDARLGGETAAAVLTNYLHPEHGVLYMQGSIHELVKALKLRADPEGNLTILDRFWESDNLHVNQIPIAPPLLVCAELLAVGGERNRETVKMIMGDLDV